MKAGTAAMKVAATRVAMVMGTAVERAMSLAAIPAVARAERVSEMGGPEPSAPERAAARGSVEPAAAMAPMESPE
jgi:hypothetical protein